MQDPMHSTPKYLKVNEIEIRHGTTLCLIQQHAIEAQALLQKLQPIDQPNVLIFGEESEAGADREHDLQALTQGMQQLLSGWHAVILGDERFIWPLEQSLFAQGMMQEEISLISSAGARQVYCVHCGQLQTQRHSNEDYCHCRQCGVYLLIRSHFSQRLGAYMGVCADADHPQGDAA